MKFILLLAFVALCYSYPSSGGRNVNINEDGTIVITAANGKRVSISKAIGTSGHKNIDIEVSGPNMPTKRIQINDHDQDVFRSRESWEDPEEFQRDKRSSRDSKKHGFQGDILAEIMKEYQGPIDEKTFEKLLKKVNKAVQSGELNETFYDILRNLEQVQDKDTMEDIMQRQAFERELKQLQQEQQGGEWQRGFTHESRPMTDNSWQQRLYPFSRTFTTPFWGTQRSMSTTGFGRVGFEVPEQMYHQTTGEFGNDRFRLGTERTSWPWSMTQQRRMLPCNSVTCLQREQMLTGMTRTTPEEIIEILEGEREIMERQKQLQQQQFIQQQQQKELQEQQEEQQEQQQIQRQLLQHQYQQQQIQQQQQALHQQQMRQQMQGQQRDWTQQQVQQQWPNQWQEGQRFNLNQWQREQQQFSPLSQLMWNMRPVQRGMMQQYGGMTREFGNQRVPLTQDLTRNMVPMLVN